VLVGDNFPELGTDLVAALASLDVNDLSHVEVEELFCKLLSVDNDGEFDGEFDAEWRRYIFITKLASMHSR
jgi:hypothetical protein